MTASTTASQLDDAVIELSETKQTPAEATPEAPPAPPADDSIPTADLMPILNEWATRYTACDDAERTLERNLGLRFMSRSYSYVDGTYDDDDRFTLNVAKSPTSVPRAGLVRAVKTCQRIHGRTGYGLNWLRDQLASKFDLDMTEYRDSFKVSWSVTVSEEDLIRNGWGGRNENIGDYARHMTNFRNADVEVIPDPRRRGNATA